MFAFGLRANFFSPFLVPLHRSHSPTTDSQQLAAAKKRKKIPNETQKALHLKLRVFYVHKFKHLMFGHKLLSVCPGMPSGRDLLVSLTFCCWILCFNYCFAKTSAHTENSPILCKFLWNAPCERLTWEYCGVCSQCYMVGAQPCVTSTWCFSLI